MTDKKPKVSTLAYTELSIQIATLDMKLNKILELLNVPEVEIKPVRITMGYGLSEDEFYEETYK